MQAHKVKAQNLLTVILITALPLSLFALAVNRLEAVSILAGNISQFEFQREVGRAGANVISGNSIPGDHHEVSADTVVSTWDSDLKLNVFIPPTNEHVVDLSLAKGVDDSTPFVGEQVVFTLRVDNAELLDDATGVVVNDLLPSGYTHVRDDGGGDYDPDTGEWEVGDIEAGAFAKLQITAKVEADGDYTNFAEITELNETDLNLTNNQDSATTTPVPVADLEITKMASSDEVTAGDDLIFTLVVTNNGPSLATSVQVTDDLSVELQLISATSTQGSCSGNVLVSCDIEELAEKGVVTITIVVNVDTSSSGSLENTASVTSATTDRNEQNNSKTISVTVLERIFLIHLPIFNRGRVFGEPNDQCETAADILVNEDNTFLPEDQDDWYQFDIASSGELVVELSNFLPMEGQLTVFQGVSCASRKLLGIYGNSATNKVLDLGTQPAGHYYIYVSNDAALSSVPYNLRVNFKP